jgi:glycosyltransferase involved in cell wall biosynthesis
MIESSILIPTRNGEEHVDACLSAIYRQKQVGAFEVILVDSGSTDATLEIARRYPVRIWQIAPESFHHARTRNYAASLATGEFVVCLSMDAIPASDLWLSALLTNFKDPSVGAVYGRQMPKIGAKSERHQVFAALYGESRLVKRPGDAAKLGYQYYHFSDVNAAIRIDVWRATRFPEDLKVFEDVGIAKRILESGWSIVYEPQAAVYHSHDFPFRTLLKRYFDIGVVYQRLGIWNRDSRRSIRSAGWRALKDRARGRLRGKPALKTTGESHGSYSVLTAAGKFVAMEMGRHERWLPLFLKRRLSQHHLFD